MYSLEHKTWVKAMEAVMFSAFEAGFCQSIKVRHSHQAKSLQKVKAPLSMLGRQDNINVSQDNDCFS